MIKKQIHQVFMLKKHRKHRTKMYIDLKITTMTFIELISLTKRMQIIKI